MGELNRKWQVVEETRLTGGNAFEEAVYDFMEGVRVNEQEELERRLQHMKAEMAEIGDHHGYAVVSWVQTEILAISRMDFK